MKKVVFVLFIAGIFFLSTCIASIIYPNVDYLTIGIGMTFGAFFGSAITLYVAKTTDLLN